MINEQELRKFKSFENIEKSTLVLAFVQQESELIYLRKEVDRLNVERNALFTQVTNAQLPVQKPLSQPQQQNQNQQRPPQQNQPQRPPVQNPQQKPISNVQPMQRVNPPQQQPQQRPPQIPARV